MSHFLALIDPSQDYLISNIVTWDGTQRTLDRLNAQVAPKFYRESLDRRFHPGYSRWNPETETFEHNLPSPTTAELRSFATAWRETLFVKGVSVTVNGSTFTVQTRNEIDLANIKALKDLARMNPDFTIPFRDADNNTHMLDASQIVELYNQVAERRLELTQIGISIKSDIDAGTITTKSEIKDSDWT